MDVNVYQHFRKDEHPFIDLVADWIEQVESQYAPYLTEFLDPREAFILETLVRQNSDLMFSFSGGYETSERNRALIYPDYYVPKPEDFEIELFEIKYPTKFAHLSHGKVLGTLVNSGLKRSFFGDIISDGERWQFLVSKNIAQYVVNNVPKIGGVSVRMIPTDYTELLLPKDDWSDETITVSSLRLDNMVASVYNISRQRAKQLIDGKKVKVNWRINEKPDFPLDLLDIVSVRGYGRIQIREVAGKTKKEKLRLSLGVLRK